MRPPDVFCGGHFFGLGGPLDGRCGTREHVSKSTDRGLLFYNWSMPCGGEERGKGERERRMRMSMRGDERRRGRGGGGGGGGGKGLRGCLGLNCTLMGPYWVHSGAVLGGDWFSTAVRRFVAFFGVWPNSRVLRQRLSGPRTSCSSGTSCRQPAFSQPVGAPGQRNDFGRWSQQRPLSIGGSVGWVGHPYGDCGASFCSHPVPLPFPVLPLGPRAFQPARASWPRPA